MNCKINIYTRCGDEVFSYTGSGEATETHQIHGMEIQSRDLPTGGYLYIWKLIIKPSLKNY
jgi:hypothetical protein